MSDRASLSDTRSPSGRRLRLAIAAGVAILLITCVGAFFMLRGDGRSHPDQWDARIEPFVKIVEDQRGLTFDHPVAVRFLEPDAFEKDLRTDTSDLDKDEREEIAQFTSLFRAFGLISGDVDLFDAINDASGTGTLAYYSFEDRAITVRGKKLTRASHAILVHELTHALQDQRFDIADRLEDLGKKVEDGEATTAADALQAIVEGDAERVADLYRASLDADERQALEEAETADTADAQAKLDKIPKIVTTLFGAPYVLGQAVTEAVAAGDQDDLDDLFDDPPRDDSVLLDPLKAIDRAGDAETFDIPSLEKGEKKIDSGQIGSLVTYLMLAERIALPEALAAADSWVGDAYVGFERDGVVCARVEYEAGTDEAAMRLTSAFDDWIAAEKGSTARIDRDGSRSTFESCDPGTSAELTNDASTDALTLVATRASLGATLVKSGASVEIADCLSRSLVDEYPVTDLTDPKFGADDPAVTKRIQELAADCR